MSVVSVLFRSAGVKLCLEQLQPGLQVARFVWWEVACFQGCTMLYLLPVGLTIDILSKSYIHQTIETERPVQESLIFKATIAVELCAFCRVLRWLDQRKQKYPRLLNQCVPAFSLCSHCQERRITLSPKAVLVNGWLLALVPPVASWRNTAHQHISAICDPSSWSTSAHLLLLTSQKAQRFPADLLLTALVFIQYSDYSSMSMSVPRHSTYFCSAFRPEMAWTRFVHWNLNSEEAQQPRWGLTNIGLAEV